MDWEIYQQRVRAKGHTGATYKGNRIYLHTAWASQHLKEVERVLLYIDKKAKQVAVSPSPDGYKLTRGRATAAFITNKGFTDLMREFGYPESTPLEILEKDDKWIIQKP